MKKKELWLFDLIWLVLDIWWQKKLFSIMLITYCSAIITETAKKHTITVYQKELNALHII